MAFVRPRHAERAAEPLRALGMDICVVQVRLDFLRSATLTSLGVAIFEEDPTISNPADYLTRVTVHEVASNSHAVARMLDACFFRAA